ncbi:MAG: GNAT family N-acetyltransferase [Myxococcota bacterium]
MGPRFAPREHRLKDGRPARVRLACPTDAAAILAVDRAVVDAGVGVVLARGDLPRHAAEQVDRLRPTLEGDPEMGAILSAEVPPPGSSVGLDGPGLVVGHGSVHRYRPSLCRHVAVIALGVRPDHQGLGLGRALLEGLVGWCELVGVERVELTVLADNARARQLYRTGGFAKEAVRQRFVKRVDEYVDDVMMARWLR